MTHRYSLSKEAQYRLILALEQAQAALPKEGIPRKIVDQALAMDVNHQQAQRDLYAERQEVQGDLNTDNLIVDDDAMILVDEQASSVWAQAWVKHPIDNA